MASEEPAGNASKNHFGMITFIGLVAIVSAVGYVAWAKGTFRPHEKVAILTWNQDPFWDPIQQGANDAAKDFGIDLAFIESAPDQASQDQHIRDLVSSGIQALAISPNNPTAQEATINDAASKAVVVTFDSDAPNTKRRGFIGTDDYAAGQIAAEQVRVAISDGGKVIISVGSIEMSNGRDRRQGTIDDLLDRPFKHEHTFDAVDADLKGSKYQVVATVTDNGDADKESKLVADAITANPDVKCIVGLFSYSGPAIVKAVATSGKKDQIKIIGFDESAEEQADVASGAIFSSVLQDQYRCGYETVRILADLLRGVGQNGPSSARLTELPVMLMRSDNIQTLRDERMIRKPDAK